MKNWFTGAQRHVVDGGSGGPDVSILRLGQIRFFVAKSVSALLMNGLSRGVDLYITSQLTGFSTPLLPLCLSYTISLSFLVAPCMQITQFSIMCYVCATTEPLQSSS